MSTSITTKTLKRCITVKPTNAVCSVTKRERGRKNLACSLISAEEESVRERERNRETEGKKNLNGVKLAVCNKFRMVDMCYLSYNYNVYSWGWALC